jgi:hypothetical protein
MLFQRAISTEEREREAFPCMARDDRSRHRNPGVGTASGAAAYGRRGT